MMVFETMFFYVEFESMKRAVRKTTVNQTLIKPSDRHTDKHQSRKEQKTKNKKQT